jgi:glutamate dehydrogenase
MFIEDETKRGQIERALAGTPDQNVAEFTRQLFARAAAEDLARYSPDDLRQLGTDAYSRLALRTPGAADVRILNPNGSPELLTVSIIEIVNDDMPFLMDSVMSDLAEHSVELRLVVHPVVSVTRDKTGRGGFVGADNADARRESLIHIHVERIADPGLAGEIAKSLRATLADVRVAVEDWKSMLARMASALTALKEVPPLIPVGELAEGIQFLEWLGENNFTFLGLREYAMVGKGAKARMEPTNASGLGLLRDPSVGLLRQGSAPVTMTPELAEFLAQRRLLIITKSSLRSRVHRRIHIDYVGVKLFDAKGAVTGELRIAGLFTSTAYTRSVRRIPYLRRKVDAVLSRAGFDPDGHSGKALVNILEQYPRDELFQIDEDQLFDFSMRILQLEERPRIRVLPRVDKFGRFMSVLVFIPRDRYTTTTRVDIGAMLAKEAGGRVTTWSAANPEGSLARLHFIISRPAGTFNVLERGALETAVAGIIRTWDDGFREALKASHGADRARALEERYLGAFPAAYQDTVTPLEAVTRDINILARIHASRPLAIDFYGFEGAESHEVALRIFNRGNAIPLSERVPILEAMGFRAVSETSVVVEPRGEDSEASVTIHDMRLKRADGGAVDLAATGTRLEAAYMAVANGRAESDGFDALVLSAGLGWREVTLVRAIARFLRQARIGFSQDYLWATLVKHSAIATDLVSLFRTQFDPTFAGERDNKASDIIGGIEGRLSSVTSLDEDRILRRFLNVVTSMLRTNFFQLGSDGQPKATLCFKLDSKKLIGLPDPRPMVEIFVFSARVEGVHLRFGRIARGGLRWSDRPQDFRTEVLGLVKAQQVKNAVIVPVGAKGGFVPKRLPPSSDRAAWLAEGTEAYKLFVAALLDVTDNISADGSVTVRDNIVRRDGDDPYLVVAADKGTATFSDIANGISALYGHWLGDAFASGGSVGYDHKKMGITARGGWEAVKRHFREMDIDIQTQPFTVAGVGDMSGDVFGNGMLLSPAIKLIAAFDHRDIFLDPNPDPAASFAERERMFALPRSSWADYDRARISAGGGVFPRSAKSIQLSPEMRERLSISSDTVTPQELMNAILRASVDLMWFGGIGTYVRASSETDEQVGDRANDAIRITGLDLRAKVIGEGANLGMTQKARIEAARNGVRLNTDAIDNSAGVNSSDVEVNFKIALGSVVASGRLSQKRRNALLAEMTPDVAALVLRNNYQQTLSLSLSQRRGVEDVGFAKRLMQGMEAEKRLDRAVEDLPRDSEIDQRATRGEALTRPELAVLLAYAKLALFDALIESSVPDDDYLGRELLRYFPPALATKYPSAVDSHRLKREIIATALSNAMINRGGSTMIPRIADQTGATGPEIAAAFAAVRDSFGMTTLNGAIDTLDTHIPGALQLSLYAGVQEVMLDRVVWMLRYGGLTSGLARVVKRFGAGVAEVEDALARALPAHALAQLSMDTSDLTRQGVPEDLARRLCALPWLAQSTDIVLVADAARVPIADAALATFALRDAFALSDIAAAAKRIVVIDYYESLALDRALSDLAGTSRRIAVSALRQGGVAAWTAKAGPALERTRASLVDIASAKGLTVAKLTVAAGLLADLATG